MLRPAQEGCNFGKYQGVHQVANIDLRQNTVVVVFLGSLCWAASAQVRGLL